MARAPPSPGRRKVKNRVSLKALCRVASAAAGVQFGWALQLSLLTPYVQELGIPHQFASLIWLCGPVSGLFVQPIVGHYSDCCTSSYGRRRPFIVGGSILVVFSSVIVAFSADLGHLVGDPIAGGGPAPAAIAFFVLGFWFLDLSNNTLQGPIRALLADFAGKDQKRVRVANGFFALFVAVGNILGFLAGAYDDWASLPFLTWVRTDACDVGCSNLKSAFLVGTVLLTFTTILSATAAEEIPWRPDMPSHVHAGPTSSTPLLAEKPLAGPSANEVSKMEDPEEDDEDEQTGDALFTELFYAIKDLPRTMWNVLLVEALTWVAWFPFLLFDTDWMGREVYLGEPSGSEQSLSYKLYYNGVHMGSLGLMLNSIVLGITSLLIDWMCTVIGASRVWALADGVVAICLACTAVITKLALREREMSGGLIQEPSTGIVIASLVVFAVLGVPYAVAYSVPYALTATYAEKAGMGQGVAMGVLTISVCIPQLMVSLLSGPFDSLFGGGNVPSFLVGAGAAALGCVAAFLLLPKPPPGFRTKTGLRRTLSSPIP